MPGWRRGSTSTCVCAMVRQGFQVLPSQSPTGRGSRQMMSVPAWTDHPQPQMAIAILPATRDSSTGIVQMPGGATGCL